MYMTAEMKQGNHVEGIMIVGLERLHVQSNVFESWIDLFFDRLKMSANTLVFTEYLGEQMLTSMDRTPHSQKLRTNIFAEWNKDLLMLYQKLSKKRADQQRVLIVTGNTIDRWQFYRHIPQNMNGLGNIHQPISILTQDWNGRILMRTLSSPHKEQATD
jgi:hypothetical protein